MAALCPRYRTPARPSVPIAPAPRTAYPYVARNDRDARSLTRRNNRRPNMNRNTIITIIIIILAVIGLFALL